ncbi:MAG: inositol monophosphatase [Candidatus Aenigmarchaeota archaeon]|nr:inositol monophosphatase [Candidatus Aenigmarchaeota archaeon]
MPYAKERRLAIDLAKKSGKIIQRGFKLGMKSWYKEDKTVVTKADIKINNMVLRSIKKAFPGHSVISEEKSNIVENNEKTWVCDPIDGTLMFLRGVPSCVFSLAYLEEGKPKLGVVFDPFMNRMFHAVIAKGAFLNRKRINVSTKTDLKYSVVGLSCWKERGAFADISDIYRKLLQNTADLFDLGSTAYQGMLVASGHFEGSIHPATSPYDSAALKIIVEESGGKMTNLFGEDQRYDQKIKGCVISNGLVHKELVEIARSSLYS